MLHTEVRTYEQVSSGNPETYEGKLNNGLWFSFWVKRGMAHLGIASDLEGARVDSYTRKVEVGDGETRAVFFSNGERNEVFAHLYDVWRRKG